MGKPDFFESATDLESSIYNSCIQYYFASQYFKLYSNNQASENEVYFMAAEMDKAGDYFLYTADIDEADGGYQYKRYKNYGYLAKLIGGTPSNGLNWSTALEGQHKLLLKWCSDWSVQMLNNYGGINRFPSEVADPLDSQRKP